MDTDFLKIYNRALELETLIQNLKQDLIKKFTKIISCLQDKLKTCWRYLNSILKTMKKLKSATLPQLSSMDPTIKSLLKISEIEEVVFFNDVEIIQKIKSNFYVKDIEEKQYIIMIRGSEDSSPSSNFKYIDLTRQSSKIDSRAIQIENFQHDEKIFTPSTLVIQLLDSNFFIFGGKKLSTARVNVFNLKNFKVEKLENREAIHSCGGCFYRNEFVLVFGGLYGTNFTTESQKYSIKTNRWEKIQPLSESLSKTTASALGNSIYITGTKSNAIYQYFFDSNMYHKLNNQQNLRILIREYIIGYSDNALFLHKIEDEQIKLKKRIDYDIQYLNTCSFVAYGDFLYFISETFDLFRIDTRNDDIQKICFLKLGGRQNTY